MVRSELAAKLEAAAATEADARAQLVAIGVAYIAFAHEHPAEFEVLFRFTRSRKRSFTDPQASSMDLLRRIARRAAPDVAADEIDVACLGMWAAAHGLATLRMVHLAEIPLDWDAWSRRILRTQAARFLCPSR